MSKSVKDELFNQIAQLPSEQQRQVLRFVQVLAGSKPQGVQGKELLRFAGQIGGDDLRAISSAILEGCEGIELNAW